MVDKQVDYAALGLKALRRAARKVAENARKNNVAIPVWRKGRVEYIAPEYLLNGATDTTGVEAAEDPNEN